MSNGWLPLIGVSALVRMAGTLALPAMLGQFVDALIRGGDSRKWLMWIALILLIGLLADLIDLVAGTANVAGETATLRGRMMRHLLAVDHRFVPRIGVGDLVSRVSSGAADAATAGISRVSVGIGLVPPIGSLVLLALIDVRLAVAFAAGLVLTAVVLLLFTRRTADVLTRYQQVQGRIAARLTESLAGARTIAAAGTQSHEEDRILAPLGELRSLGVRTWRVLARAGAQSALVGPLIQVSVLAVAGLSIMEGRITVGELLAASQYALIGTGIGSLTSVLSRLARSQAGRRRAAEVLAEPIVHYGAERLPDGDGELCVAGVTVPAGATAAIVGRSGSGKSAFAQLAAQTGTLDGTPLPELSKEELQAAVGYAFERPVLTGETIADAIGAGRDRPGVIAAAQAAWAHDFIMRLPYGYDTALADAPMSGGELQRLGLARAWYAQRLLVLDDALSSVDMVTEMQINKALTEDPRRRTRLIVTHRVTTAARADLVIWLDAGEVRAAGSHSRLWTEFAGYREVFG